MASGARKAAEEIYSTLVLTVGEYSEGYQDKPREEWIANAERIISAACSPVAPVDVEALAERQAEQIAILFNGDLSGGTSIRNALANILRVALRPGAAPAVTPRCPKCGKGTSLTIRNYMEGLRLVCGANCGFILAPTYGLEFPLADFAQFFQPAQPKVNQG